MKIPSMNQLKSARLWLKLHFFGSRGKHGWFYQAIMYFLLVVLGFVFVYPLLYMFSISLMSNIDLVDNSVRWIPTQIDFTSYQYVIQALEIPGSFLTSAFVAGISTLSVAIASAFIGYGLSRFPIPGKKWIFVIMIFTFIMPKTLFFIPTYQIFTTLHLKGNLLAILLPALTGQGLQGPFFVLIFFHFFNLIPKQLEEAAIIDGASRFKIFYKIAIPMVGPAFIITAVYSFSLYWSETFLLGSYLEGSFTTVTMLLNNLQNHYWTIINQSGLDPSRMPNLSFTEAKLFAGTLLSIIPLIVMYIIFQRWFVESIDKTGISGE